MKKKKAELLSFIKKEDFMVFTRSQVKSEMFNTITVLEKNIKDITINEQTFLKDSYNLLDKIKNFNAACVSCNFSSRKINAINYLCNNVNEDIKKHILRTLNLHKNMLKEVTLEDFKKLILPHAFKIYKKRLNSN